MSKLSNNLDSVRAGRKTFINDHGVECIKSSTGQCFCHIYAERKKDRKRVRVNFARVDFDSYYDEDSFEWVTNDLVLVPVVCLDCGYYDPGEHGDFGTLLAGPICGIGVYFPTASGACGRKQT